MNHRALLCAVFALCLGACGGKGKQLGDDQAGSGGSEQDGGFNAGSDPDRNAVKPGELCDRLSTVQCAGEAACCEKPGRDFDECKAAMLDGCKNQLHLDEIAMRKETGFDAERAEAAFAGFEKLAKKCDPSIAEWGSSVDGLRGMLQGTVAGEKNCAPHALTDTIAAGAALSACKEPDTYACLPRATRLSGMPDWTCDEKSDKGGDCFSDYNCKDGLYCDNPRQQLGAVCKPRKAVGAACTFPSACETLACQDGKCAATSIEAAYCLAQ